MHSLCDVKLVLLQFYYLEVVFCFHFFFSLYPFVNRCCFLKKLRRSAREISLSQTSSCIRHSRVPDFIPYKVWYYYINFDRVGSCNKLVFYISWGPYFKTATPSSAFFFMARIFFTMLCSPYTSMSLCFLPLFSNFKEIFDGGYCWKSRDEYEKTAWGMLPDIRSISSSWHFLARSF